MEYQVLGRRRGVRVGACLALATVALSACSSSSSGGGGSPSAGGGSSSGGGGGSSSGGSGQVAAAKAILAQYTGEVSTFPSVAPLAGVSALKGKSIWYVPIGSGPPSLNTFGTGIQQAVSHVGMTVHVCDGKFLPTGIASCLSQAKSGGASAVITGYLDYKLVPTSFNDLVSSHIPVLIAGSAPSDGKTSSPKLAWYDTTGTSQMKEKLQMNAVIADSNGKAKVLYIGVTDSPQLIAEADYSVKYLKDHCSGCSVNRVDVNTPSLSKLGSQVSAALISHPDTTYVVNEIDPYVEQTIAGVQSAGFANKVKLAATNGDLPSLQRVKSGTLQFADAGFSTLFAGWQWGDAAMRMLLGKTPKSDLSVFRLFTKDNVSGLKLTPQAYETIDWYSSKDFRPAFLSAWGVH